VSAAEAEEALDVINVLSYKTAMMMMMMMMMTCEEHNETTSEIASRLAD